MKKNLLILFGFLPTFSLIAQQNEFKQQTDVPTIIKYTFKEKYPNVVAAKNWKKENETYIGKFRWNKKKYEAIFDENGKWVKTFIIIKWKEVPEVVKVAYKKSAYIEWKIDNIIQVDSSSEPIVYIIVLDNQFNFPITEYSSIFYDTNEVYISEHGQIIKVQKKG